MSLKFIQEYEGTHSLRPPMCYDCTNRAVGLWQDTETGEAPDLCEKHAKERGAPMPVDDSVQDVNQSG